jgi:hypothetical protein
MLKIICIYIPNFQWGTPIFQQAKKDWLFWWGISNMATKASISMGLSLLLLSAFFGIATSTSNTSNIITTLPGYSGELPFTLETG